MKLLRPLLILVVACSTAIAQDTLRIGIIPYKTDDKILESYTPMFEYIGKKLNKKIKIDLVSDKELGYKLHHNQYDLGVFKPFPYLKAHLDFPDLEVFASHEVGNALSYTGLIISRKDQNINAFKDFKGKHFLFIKPTSTTGYRYPKGVFKEHEIDIDSNYFEYDFSYSHEKAIDALLAGEADGIAVAKSELMKKGVEMNNLKVHLEFSAPNHAYVFSPKLDTAAMAAIQYAMFHASKDPDSYGIFENSLEITNWKKVNDNHYNYLRRYLRIVRVQPSVRIDFDFKESAAKALNQKGDVQHVVESNVKDELKATKRFRWKKSGAVNYELHVIVSQLHDEMMFYKLYNGEEKIGEGEVTKNQIWQFLPAMVRNDFLGSIEEETDLLFNGKEYFITMGKNDGYNQEDYGFFVKKTGAPLQVSKLNDLNIYFEEGTIGDGAKVLVKYLNKDLESNASIMDNFEVDGFWNDNFWDKLGLLVGVLLAVFSGVVGWVFQTRKKRKFKYILNQTKDLFQEMYEDKIKMETKLIELKHNISEELEKGSINENQFLILKTKLDEIESHLSKTQEVNEEIESLQNETKKAGDLLPDEENTDSEEKK